MTSKMKFTAEVGKVLRMMIHSVYTNKEIFLRELVSNASDACEKFRYKTLLSGIDCPNDDLEIKILANQDTKELIIEDNGIGMSMDDLIKNLGSIATSGTQRFIEQMETTKDNGMIGQFGVGFYSAFMVSNYVTVHSSIGDGKVYAWSSDGEDGFGIEESDINLGRGTRVTLKIKEDDLEFLEKYKIQHIIKTYSDHISFPIYLIEDGSKKTRLNKEDALWLKSPNSVSEKEYDNFYNNISYMPGSPFITIHTHAEGGLTYRSLLFIPSTKPYDLFHHQAKPKIKLFINRVFITDEESGLLPSYMRFIKGVVDSEDLPLNVSRETLQHNSTVAKIKRAITNKVLSSLEKKRSENYDEFLKFWSNFGEVIKEGLCQGALEEKEKLLDLCIFDSLNAEQKMITLKEYTENMKNGQEEIYYIVGNSNLTSLRNSPQLEGFKKRGVDVLLLKDNVDDFWVNVVYQYNTHQLKSVSSTNIDLDKIEKLEDKQDETHINKEDKVMIIECLKSILGTRVKDICISTKLIDNPACLSIQEGHMSSRMESALIEQRQLPKRSLKILEINPNHKIIKKLLELYRSSAQHEAAYIANLIFGQACLLEGEPIDDVMQFIDSINGVCSGYTTHT